MTADSTRGWKILTLLGEDRPGIVANVTQVLFGAGAELGEASMMRLGDQFAIMMMVRHAGDPVEIMGLLESLKKDLNLKVHIDEVETALHRHQDADVVISVHGADRPGIVAQVTQALADVGFNILDLRSDVAGTTDKPIYIMQIEGKARNGLDSIERALASLPKDIEVVLHPIDMLRG